MVSTDQDGIATGGALVIGASQAGVQLAVSLRELGYSAPVTLVGSERHAPYQRPALSKDFLSGSVETDGLRFRSASFYREARIELVRGERIATISLDESCGSGTAVAESGRRFGFDQLALTVGGRPRRLDVPGSDLGGICYLRKLDDAESFRQRLNSAQRVVVIGGGFIGLEIAAAARHAGRAVTVVESTDRLIGRAVAPAMSDFYRRAHEQRGTTVRLSTTVTEFLGEGDQVAGVRLSDGAELSADLVLVGIGLVPHTRLAESLGLDCDGGIVVDECARTSNPAIVAAGDCTVLPHPMSGVGRVRIESVQNAVSQAKVAAATLADRPGAYSTVPWFWSHQGDLRLQIAGLSYGYDRTVLRGEPATEQFSLLYYRGDQLLAVDAVNAPRDYMAVRKALTDGINIPPSVADEAATPLKEFLKRVSPQRKSVSH